MPVVWRNRSATGEQDQDEEGEFHFFCIIALVGLYDPLVPN